MDIKIIFSVKVILDDFDYLFLKDFLKYFLKDK